MKRSHYLFLTLCLMVALVAPQAVARDVAFLQTDTVEVPAQKMNRSIKVAVVVPHQYRIYPDTKYPVVYLLHGAWGCYRDWPHKANLDSLAGLTVQHELRLSVINGMLVSVDAN